MLAHPKTIATTTSRTKKQANKSFLYRLVKPSAVCQKTTESFVFCFCFFCFTQNISFYISFFHRFSPFNCCLSVVLWLDKGDYPENSHVVFYLNKQRSFKTFMFGSCFRVLAVILVSVLFLFYSEPFFFLELQQTRSIVSQKAQLYL